MIRIFGQDVALGQLVLRRLDQLPYIIVAFVASYALLGRLRRGDWFDRRRVVVLGGILLAVQTLGFVFLIAVSYGLIVPQAKPQSTDFVSFYAAGSLAATGLPELAYDRSAHYDAEQEATETGITYQYFFYPPVFLVLCRALAQLPYLGAYIAFEAATLGLYLIATRGILKEPGSGWLIPVLAFPAVFWTLGYGQNAFLTAALFGGATLLIDRRPIAAGFLFGTLCYKPHFGLLVPVALAAGRRWNAFATTAAAVAGWIGVSVALFGWETWHAYPTAFLGSGTISDYELEHFNSAGFISLFSASRLAGVSIDAAHAVQLAGAMAAVALVGWIWWRNCSLPVRSAALAAGTLIAIPFAVLYDLMLATIAMAWLVRAGRQRGFLRYDEPVIAANYLIPLLALHVGIALHIPLGPLPALALEALCAVRASREVSAARSHFLQGNALKRRQVVHDEAVASLMFDRIRAVFSAELMRSKADQGDLSPLPVFILGMPRSGSTLIEQILASHPKVFAAGERLDLRDALNSFGEAASVALPSPSCLWLRPEKICEGWVPGISIASRPRSRPPRISGSASPTRCRRTFASPA